MSNLNLVAAGTSQSYGSLGFVNDPPAYVESLQAGSYATSYATFKTLVPTGAITDYGYWDNATTTQVDPAIAVVYSGAAYTNTAWSRPYTAASQPKTYFKTLNATNPSSNKILWPAAGFASVGLSYASTANAAGHYVDRAMLEKSVGTQVNILPFGAATMEGEEVPYGVGFTDNAATVERSSERKVSGTYSLKITINGATETYYSPVPWAAMANVAGMSGTIKAQAAVSAGQANRMYRCIIRCYDAAGAVTGNLTGSDSAPSSADGSWFIVKVSGSLPANTVWASVIVGQRATNATGGDTYYVDDLRLYPPVSNQPTPHEAPRKLTLNVKPNRVNFCKNPSFRVDTKGWGTFGSASPTIARDTTVYKDGVASLKVTVPYYTGSWTFLPWYGASTKTIFSTAEYDCVSGLKANVPYTVSAWVRRAPGCPNILMVQQGGEWGWSYDNILAYHPELVDGEWVRMFLTITLPEGTSGDTGFSWFVEHDSQTPNVDSVWWIADVLVEEGIYPSPYIFDGSTSSDTLWTGTTGWSRSHLYEGRRERSYLIDDIMRKNLPVDLTYEVAFGVDEESYQPYVGAGSGPTGEWSLWPFRPRRPIR